MADFSESEKLASETSIALQTAWRRCGELRAASRRAKRRDARLQAGFITTIFLAVLIAVFTVVAKVPVAKVPVAKAPETEASADSAARPPADIELIVVLILGSLLLTLATRASDRNAGGLLRGGAAEMEGCIFFFSTLLEGHEGRETWLLERVRAIRRRVFERLGRELAPRPGDGAEVFPIIDRCRMAEHYLEWRVESKAKSEARRARGLDMTLLWLQLLVFAAIGGCLLLAALGGSSTLLVAVTASGALSLFAWSGLRCLGARATRHREIAFALGQIRDHWRGLDTPERTGERFRRLVVATENVLGCAYKTAALTTRLAVAELSGHSEDLLEQILKRPVSDAVDTALAVDTAIAADVALDAPIEQNLEVAEASTPSPPDGIAPKHPPHAFVVMPFGRKQSGQGNWIDFDRIYRRLIRPALEQAGFESFRADEETVSGDILTDMFQELLLADVVIADMSIDNANVFYEIGVRHAMRKRGVIHIQSGRSYMPFDIFNVRTIPYHCDASGGPDPAHLNKDLQAISQCARETWASNKERVHSPIFNLLDGLTEPDRRALRTPLASGYWRQHNEWQQRMEVARRRKSVGDLLLLTEEARNPLVQEEAVSKAGVALRTLGLDELALRQYRRGLELNPRSREFRCQEAIHLGRLERYEEAVVKLRQLLQDDPKDIEALFALGEIYENIWRQEFEDEEFQGDGKEGERLEEAYQASDWLKKAIDTFLQAYRLDLNHCWSGTKAYVLSMLLRHVSQQDPAKPVATDPELGLAESELETLCGAVRFTLESRGQHGVNDFDSLVRLGYMAVCEADNPRQVTKAFRKALTMSSKNRFYLEFTLDRLKLFQALGFRPEFTRAGIEAFSKELEHLREAESRVERDDYRPPKVFLFEGLEIDRPGQPEVRFPAGMAGEVDEQLHTLMDELEAGENDLGITASAACGGDILFIEDCLARGMRVQVHLPLDKSTFIERSVAHGEKDWVERFYRLNNHPDVTFLIQQDRVGPVPDGDEAYERSNRWAVYSALGHGIERVRLILLWDGQTGAARGGAHHMLHQVKSVGGQYKQLDTSKFDYWRYSATQTSPRSLE